MHQIQLQKKSISLWKDNYSLWRKRLRRVEYASSNSSGTFGFASVDFSLVTLSSPTNTVVYITQYRKLSLFASLAVPSLPQLSALSSLLPIDLNIA